jgi:hypothetical protein
LVCKALRNTRESTEHLFDFVRDTHFFWKEAKEHEGTFGMLICIFAGIAA